MASNELIIDDDYCRTMGEYFVKKGNEMDRLVSDYVSILQTVKNAGIKSGDVSDALGTYITYVKKMNQKVGNISKTAKEEINRFLARVDAEDKYLF